jgi:drug/metabolite transporter (DMT)-like permease
MMPALPIPSSQTKIAEAMAVGAAIAFSFKAILVKLCIREGADPVGVLALRLAMAAPFFIYLWWSSAGRRPTAREAGVLALLGFGGYYLAALFDFIGLRYISAGLERVILYVHPTLVLLFGALAFGRRVSPRELGGVGLAWLGLLVAASGDLGHVALPDLTRGAGLVLACAVLYAIFLLGLEKLGPELGAVRVSSAANLMSALCLGLHVGLLQPDALSGINAQVVGLTAALALGATVFPAVLLARAVSQIGPARASTLGMVGPLSAGLLGWATLGEPLSPLQLLGGLLVVAGVSVSRPPRA